MTDPRDALRQYISDSHSDWLENADLLPLDVGPGWLGLVRALLNAIGRQARDAGATVHVSDIKEKYGSLRVSLRHNGDEEFDRIVRRFVDHAEYHSNRVCDQCGEPGRLRAVGWWATRCDAHAHGRSA